MNARALLFAPSRWEPVIILIISYPPSVVLRNALPSFGPPSQRRLRDPQKPEADRGQRDTAQMPTSLPRSCMVPSNCTAKKDLDMAP
ncbi:hypothetical protein XA68_18113 [Ophiocordyceps unilateralis]|uniref:Uncharacterized protein n=1 Tax=Ophiocordyceps unilateralis TaxID=268505 RepID=A0A2A9P2H4_OPHUN|nr:hypothetical protein XA68_18113 [Ophiocordyceps unilateralis]